MKASALLTLNTLLPLSEKNQKFKSQWLKTPFLYCEKTGSSHSLANYNYGMEKNTKKIQKVLVREMTTKNVPKIIFEVDNTFNNVLRINELLDRTTDNE